MCKVMQHKPGCMLAWEKRILFLSLRLLLGHFRFIMQYFYYHLDLHKNTWSHLCLIAVNSPPPTVKNYSFSLNCIDRTKILWLVRLFQHCLTVACVVHTKMINLPTLLIAIHPPHIKRNSMQLVCNSVVKAMGLNVTAFLQTLTSHSSIL